MKVILHICSRAAWAAARTAGAYRPDSVTAEGFIHCSTREQVLGPANELYRGRQDLVLLVIDESRVNAPVVYEDCYETGQLFPHVYGALNLEAVVRTVAFPPGSDGLFQIPEGL